METCVGCLAMPKNGKFFPCNKVDCPVGRLRVEEREVSEKEKPERGRRRSWELARRLRPLILTSLQSLVHGQLLVVALS